MAIITDMGNYAPYRSGILQPKLKNRWRVTFLGLSQDTQGLTVQAINCELPKIEYEEVQLDRYNSRAWVAAKHMFQPINVTFEDDVGGEVVTTLQVQQERQQHITGVTPAAMLGASAAGELYKFNTRIDQLDGNHQSSTSRPFASWMLEGCFFQNIDFGDMDYAVSESIKIQTRIRFDHARNLITGVSYKAHNGSSPLT